LPSNLITIFVIVQFERKAGRTQRALQGMQDAAKALDVRQMKNVCKFLKKSERAYSGFSSVTPRRVSEGGSFGQKTVRISRKPAFTG